MEQRQRIVLYGQSVVLGAVQASLRRYGQLEVISLAPSATAQELAAAAPDVILFDAGAGCAGPAFSLLHDRPELLLVGMDPSSEEMLVLSSYPAQVLSVADLVNVIRQKGSD
jgi:hypothetical protein